MKTTCNPCSQTTKRWIGNCDKCWKEPLQRGWRDSQDRVFNQMAGMDENTNEAHGGNNSISQQTTVNQGHKRTKTKGIFFYRQLIIKNSKNNGCSS